MRKLLFTPCGIGLGHATRAKALINEVRSRAEYRIATYGPAVSYFTKLGFDVLKLKGFDFHGTSSFEVMTTLTKEADVFFKLAGDHMQISKLEKEFPFDTVISDTDPIGIVSASLLGKRNIMVENMRSSLREFQFIPKRYQDSLKFQYSLFQQLEGHATSFLDEIIVASFNPAPFVLKKEHNVGLISSGRVSPNALKDAEKRDFIVFPVPGSKMVYSTVTQLVKLFKQFNETFFVINYPIPAPKKVGNVVFLPFMDDDEVRAYIKASKAVITFAGYSTLTDVALFKKPALILPLDNHLEQLSNASYFRRKKLAEVVYPRSGSYDDQLLLKSLSAIIKDANFYSSSLDSAGFNFNGLRDAASIILGN